MSFGYLLWWCVLYGEPLVVSCERTVRAGGGLVRDTRMVVTSGRVAGNFIALMQTGPRRISGRAQDTTRGGVWDSMLPRTIVNPALCKANSQMPRRASVNQKGLA